MNDDVTPGPVEDNTSKLQRWADDGLRIPAGVFQFSGQIAVSRGMAGCGRQDTRLVYTGPPRPDGAIKVAAGSWGFKMEGFDLSIGNDADHGNAGSGVGIGLGTDLDHSPDKVRCGGGTMDRVSVSGFETGFQFGDDEGRSVSEMVCTNIQASHCGTGIRCDAWNTLNLVFVMPGFMSCGTGLDSIRSGSIHVVGGSATEVAGDVFMIRAGGVFSVKGFRAEGCGMFLYVGNTTATTEVTVESCHTQGMHPVGDGIDIAASWGADLTVRSSILEGSVYYNPTNETGGTYGYGSVTLDNVRTRSPVLLDSVHGCKLRYVVRNCALIGEKSGEVYKRLDVDEDKFRGPI